MIETKQNFHISTFLIKLTPKLELGWDCSSISMETASEIKNQLIFNLCFHYIILIFNFLIQNFLAGIWSKASQSVHTSEIIDWNTNKTPRWLTHKFLALPAFLQPFWSDYVLDYRYSSEELHRSCHFVSNQMSALLSAVSHFPSKIIQFLQPRREREREMIKGCRGGRAEHHEGYLLKHIWMEQYISQYCRTVQREWPFYKQSFSELSNSLERKCICFLHEVCTCLDTFMYCCACRGSKPVKST